MLLISSPIANFEVRSLLSLDVYILSNINLYISNKLVSKFWSISHMYLYVQKLFSSNWCIYITYFFICSYMMSFNFGFFFYDPIFLYTIIPIKIYSNAEADKDIILKENKNKSGIYKWKNIINDKQYIGSAVDLSDRLSKDYSTAKAMENYLKNYKSSIYSALLKHGYENFSLTILEYCEPEKCIEREDYYLCSLPHEYNILPGSSLGHKHSDKTKKIMSDAKKGENNPNYGKKVEGSGKPSQIFKQ